VDPDNIVETALPELGGIASHEESPE